MKLQLKFRSSTTPVRRDGVIAKVTRAGAAGVRQLFPGEKDAELASLYVVDIEDARRHGAIRSILSSAHDVEFVEDEVKRKLKSSV